MVRLSDISLPPEHSAHQLPFEAARMLRVPNSKIQGVRIVRRSVDARKKPNVRIIYTIDVTVDGSEKKILKQSGCKRASIAPATRYRPPKSAGSPEKRPVVVGFGPGGMFAALILALAGWKPLVLERGEDAASRHAKVEKFFQPRVCIYSESSTRRRTSATTDLSSERRITNITKRAFSPSATRSEKS